MVKFSRALSGALVVIALAACSDPLTVENTNNPDRLRVYGRPTDVEALIKGTFKTLYNGTYGLDAGIAPAARTMSWENASTLNNWGMGPRSAIPRPFIDNNRGNLYLTENRGDWNAISRALRSAADGVFLMDGLTLGSAAANARARAFAWFSVGAAMGYLALNFDSATIVDPHADIAIIPGFSYYPAVNAAALVALDSALAWTTTARIGYGTGDMLDNTWLNGSAFTADRFTQLIRTYKAYFRANVARSPTERAAVNWANVRDDAAAGITADFDITTGSAVGWMAAGNQWYLYQQWHQLNQFLGGMADSSCVDAGGAFVACGGAGSSRQYDVWLATSDANKAQFMIRTPDLRFPTGTTRALQQAASPITPSGRLYFRNRTTADPDAAPWGSYYDWYRKLAWYNAIRVGPSGTPFPKAMNDLLRAEALIRLGDIPGAAALIDLTRTTSGLPALAGVVTSATQPVPGGNACVPHVPNLSGTTWSSSCGTIMEAMKWEYRMETMYLSYVSSWYSGRGWGDLAEGTPVHWPVPYQEMDTRRQAFYNMGGVDREGGSVGKGTYGL